MTTFDAELSQALPVLRRWALRMTRANVSLSDDLVQETVMKALINRDKYQLGTNMKAWLCAICLNEFRNHLRDRKRDVEDPEGTIASTVTASDNPELDCLSAEAQAEIQDLMQFLLPSERMVFEHWFNGMPQTDIAEALGLPIGTVKSRISRATLRMQRIKQRRAAEEERNKAPA